jgi:hypothetical protein
MQTLTSQKRGRRSLDLEGDVAHSVKIAIVENEGRSAAGKANITFDSGPGSDCSPKCRHAVFRNSRAVQSAMGKAPRPGVEGIRP